MELEKKAAELKEQVSAQPTDELNEKIEHFLCLYADCAIMTANAYRAGKSLDIQAIHALGDMLRAMHHILKMKKVY